jgi:peptide/nickel transport system permease protein
MSPFNKKIIWIALIIHTLLLLGGLFLSHGSNIQNPEIRNQLPSFSHPLGTDDFGMDIARRMFAGYKYTFIMTFLTVTVSFVLGTFLGGIIGFLKGRIDWLLMTFIDTLQAFPPILVAVLIAGFLGGGLKSALIAVGVVKFPVFLRIARSSVQSESTQLYVLSARMAGSGPGKIMISHIFPSIYRPLLIYWIYNVTTGVIDLAALSFLGIGARFPMPEWGAMMHQALQYLLIFPWPIIVITVFLIITTFPLYILIENGVKKSEI